MKYFGLFFLFLVAFDPQVPFLPSGVGFTFVVAIILFLPVLRALVSGQEDYVYFSDGVKGFFMLYVLSLAFIVIRILLNGGEGATFLLAWARAFFVFLSVFFVYVIFYSNKNLAFFFSSLLFVYVLNAVINILSGSLPSYFFVLDYFRGDSSGYSNSLGGNPYRDSFLAGSGYYSIGTAYGLIATLFVSHMIRERAANICTILGLVLVVFSGFIAARTSFFAIALVFLYALSIRPFFAFIILFLGALVLYLLLKLPGLGVYQMWMLSFFDIQDNPSAKYLIDSMYFWPGLSVMFIGEGVVNDGGFAYTDSGYMKDLLFGGLFFLIIKMCFLMVFVSRLLKFFPILVLIFASSVLVFHFKGQFIYNNAQGMAAFFFSYLYLTAACRYDQSSREIGG
ncbi:hypothetical protein [Zhongshania arctica]|uniref:Uncharacterized protein n=1 Tax=Zhongshania arctica TaxID=3238302 RepID=A0ABV3TRV4_9GAMM